MAKRIREVKPDSELQRLLQTMRVPTQHRFDYFWLAKNLYKENSTHKNYKRAMNIIVTELKRRLDNV